MFLHSIICLLGCSKKPPVLNVRKRQSQHFDTEYQTHYWHNTVTGQSIWCDDDEAEDFESAPKEIQMQSHISKHHNGSPTESLEMESKSAGNDHIISGIDNRLGDFPTTQYPKKPLEQPHSIDREAGLEMGTVRELINPQISHSSTDSAEYDDGSSFCQKGQNEQLPRSPSEPSISRSMRRDICLYSVCIFINAFFVEGPLAVVEGSLRASICLVGSAVALILAALFRDRAFLLMCFFMLRDSILCIGAVATLCLPGSPCIVYRWYHMDREWELAPIPTILGWVDARRFVSFTFGNGCFASNVRHDNFLYDGTERDHPDGIKYNSASQQEDLARQCQDSWEGNIFFEPRRVHADIMRIYRGDDRLQILHRPGSKIDKSLNKEYTSVGVDDDEVTYTL